MAYDGNYTAIVQVAVSDKKLLQQLDQVSKKVKPIEVKVKADTSELDKFKQSVNSSGKELENFSKNGNTVVQTAKQISDGMSNASKHTKSLGTEFAETIGKVGKLYTATLPIQAMQSVILEAKDAVFEFDEAFTELSKVSDLNSNSLREYTEMLGEMGQEVGRTRTEMTQAATEFVKTGANEEDAAQLAKVATLYQNIADSQLTAGEASAYITSQMKAFNITANDAISIIDKTNEVSNNFAVSSSDISSALTKTSGAMATYGNTIDETIGLTVAGTEILTGQAGKVSRGLRSVGAEIVKLANDTGEFSYQVDGATKTLSLFDEQGKMLSTFDVLSKIYEDWNKMNEAEQSSLALTLGMKTQIDVLSATLTNFDSALNAVETSQESSGSAMKENERYMESLGAKVNNLKAQFQELILGEGGISSFIKLILDAGTSILKFANSDVGQVIIKTTLLVTTLNLASKGFNLLKTNIISSVKEFIAYQTALVAGSASTTVMYSSTQLLTGGLIALGKAWLMSPLGMATVAIGGILGIAYAIDKLTISEEEHNKKIEEQNNKLNKSNQEYNNFKNEINSLETELSTVNSQIQNINSLNGAQTVRDGELEKLQEEREELELKLALLKEEQAIKAQEAYSSAVDSMGNKVTSRYETETQTGTAGYGAGKQSYEVEVGKEIFGYEELNNAVLAMQKYETEVENTRAKLNELRNSGDTTSQEFVDLSKSLQDSSNNLSNTRKDAKKLANTLKDQTDTIDNVEGGYEDLDDTTKDLYKNTKKSLKGWEKMADSLEDIGDAEEDASEKSTDAIKDSISARQSMNEATQEEQDIISSLASELDDITNAYQTAVDAQYEYNQQGYLSIDTYSQLMQLSPEYLAMMFDENGQLYANADATNYLYQARVLEMGVAAARAQIDLASHLSQDAGAYAQIGQMAAGSVGGVMDLVRAELKLKQTQLSVEDYNALVKNINAIDSLTASTMANVGATTASIKPTNAATGAANKNTGAHKGNTGARNKNTNAIKAQTEALKKQKAVLEAQADALEKELDDYEIVIDYVKDLMKEEQEALEEAKDKELESIEKKMDALEKEQEAFEENVDAQLDALERQRDETEDYWDAQIEAIERENDALEENIELQRLQEALAKAKSQKVKVLKGGKFVYAEDEEAISKAEQELADYEQQLAVQRQIEELEKLKEQALNSLDKQIEELEKYRDETKKNYENQLKDLQEHYDKVEAQYDAQIKQYDIYMKQFEDMLNASAKKHAEILYKELVGEQKNWNDRMKALSGFVNNYDKKRAQLDKIKGQIESIDNQIKRIEASSRNSYNAARNYATSAANAANAAAGHMARAQQSILGWQVTASDGIQTRTVAGKNMTFDQAMSYYFDWASRIDGKGHKVFHSVNYGRYANGTYSIPEDQIALVADPTNPSNRELVVGSKLNHGDGVLGNFQKGTGIIPHGQTLTENLVNLARWSQNGGLERISNTTNSTSSKVIHIDNINLPEVTDGQGFVQYLENNFMNDSIQFANVRG